MYAPKPLGTPPGALAASLAGLAHTKQLTIYAGAGISAADPTLLPGAAVLANRIWNKLSPLMDLGVVDEWDLLAVADAVVAHPNGAQLLRQTVLEVADMKSAPFNYAHEVIALLLCEGVATVLEMNYDNCIERAAQPEIPSVVRTSAELLHGPRGSLLKVHGCATLPPTMLVTTEDLVGVGFWADAAVRAHLSQDHFVFIGIGSVADYVRASLKKVTENVGSGHLYLVDPALANWDDDEDLDWRTLLGDLPSDQRVAAAADEFCDALLRAYLLVLCHQLRGTVIALPEEHPQKAGVGRLLNALCSLNAVAAMRWLRGVSWRYVPGQSVASAAVTLEGLVALSGLLGSNWTATNLRTGLIDLTPLESSSRDTDVSVLPLLAGEGVSGSLAVHEAERRVTMARLSGEIPTNAEVLVVAGGHLGGLGSTELEPSRDADLDVLLEEARPYFDRLAHDLVSESEPNHLIDGPRPGRIVFVRAAVIGDVA